MALSGVLEVVDPHLVFLSDIFLSLNQMSKASAFSLDLFIGEVSVEMMVKAYIFDLWYFELFSFDIPFQHWQTRKISTKMPL